VFYFCYQLWRHNGEYFFVSSTLLLRLTGYKGAGHGTSFVFFCLFGTIYSTYASAWAGSAFPVAIKADCWVLGFAYGLVSVTPTCAFHVPTRRATLLEPYSGAFQLIISHCASLTASTTVLLLRPRKRFTTSKTRRN
jgi:hypothetical protein